MHNRFLLVILLSCFRIPSTTALNVSGNLIGDSMTAQNWDVTVTQMASDGLVAHYAFDGTANDESDHGNHGVTSGVSYTDDRFGTSGIAIYFDGDDNMSANDHDAIDFGLSTDFTITGWFKSTSSANGTLINKKEPGGSGYYAWLRDDGAFYFGMLENGGGSAALVSSVGYDDGAWHHFAVKVDRDGDLILAMDGISDIVESQTTNSINIDNNNPLEMGFTSDVSEADPDLFFTGALDDIRIYNRLLSSDEILAIYQSNAWGQSANLNFTTPATVFPGIAGDGALDFADYDDDGDQDLLVSGVSSSDYQLWVYRNDNGQFTQVYNQINNSGGAQSDVAWGDYNNDGAIDFAISGLTGGEVIKTAVYKNIGNDQFQEIGTGFSGIRSGQVNWGDLNGDNLLDLFISGANDGDNAVHLSEIYINVGNDNFSKSLSLQGHTQTSNALVDVDGDLDLDIFMSGLEDDGGSSVSKTRIYINNGTGGFTENTSHGIIGLGNSANDWGDYDKDGDLDLVLTGASFQAPFDRQTVVYENDGGQFTLTRKFTGVHQGDVKWNDFNNDGKLDLVLSGNIADGTDYVTEIHLGDGVGNFTKAEVTALKGSNDCNMSIADYDEDGDQDIFILGEVFEEGSVLTIYQNEFISINNNAPTDIQLTSFTIDENMSANSTVGNLSTTDPDADNNHTYSLVSGTGDTDNGNFFIDGDVLKTNAVFDFESKTTYTIRIETNDLRGGTYQESFTISIINVNESPEIKNILAPEFVASGSDVTIEATVEDPEYNLSEVRIYFKGAASSTFNNPPTIMELSGEDYVATITSNMFNELGLSFFIEADDGVFTTPSDVQTINVQLAEGDEQIDGLQVSEDSLDYAIIAMPYKTLSVNEVFSGIVTSPHDPSKWRLLHWTGNEYLEYPSLTNFEPGKGYWFLNNVSSSISLGQVTTVPVDDDSPFSLSLQEGQNQIGNPFPYPIDWQAVIDHNASQGITVAGVSKWDKGWTLTKGSINQYEGGFLSHTAAQTIEIPVSSINTSGRTYSTTWVKNYGRPGTSDWEFGLNLDNGILKYHVSAVGMSAQFNDQLNMQPLPRLAGYLDIIFDNGQTRNFVAHQETYKWVFEVQSNFGELPTVLSWNNQPLQGNDYGLYLVDLNTQVLIDMSQSNQYQFSPSGNYHGFELYFGLKSDLMSAISADVNVIGKPYPVPFKDAITIPLALNTENTKVNISVLDLSGRLVGQQKFDQLSSGYHRLKLTVDPENLIEGVYILQIDILGHSVQNRRIIYRPY